MIGEDQGLAAEKSAVDKVAITDKSGLSESRTVSEKGAVAEKGFAAETLEKPVSERPAAERPERIAPQPPASPTQPGSSALPPSTPPSASPLPGSDRNIPTPLRREDYVPASGSGTTQRTMKSREMPSDTGPRLARRPKGRPGPALPKLAELPPAPKAPTGPSGAAGEAPAQKPDLRLSAKELIAGQGKPLQDHINKHAEEKKNKKRVEVIDESAEELGKRPGLKGAAGKAVAGTPAAGLLGDRKARQARRAKGTALLGDEEGTAVETKVRIRPKTRTGRRTSTQTPLKTSAEIELPITVRSLSAALGRPAKLLLGSLMHSGVMASMNSTLEEDTALDLAIEMGVDLHIKRGRDIEQELVQSTEVPSGGENLMDRPPIVTILGHVDHGKTTLLDKIRSTNVAGGEVGGITQHIAAYQVEHNSKKITFLDTPGHAAFGEMRARGANVTDVAVLVVSAGDGVMPQTVEAISHAKAAGVPIVVALNKIDLPDTNEQRVLQELAAHNVLAAEWGGDTEVVRTSGLTGQGIDQLLETLLTIAELGEFKADPDRAAHGTCVEAFRTEGRGVLVWMIVQDGTLRKGDMVLCGPAFGRIRNIYNDLDQEIEEAGPSTPVKVAGLDIVPGAGDQFFVVADVEEARQVALARRERGREKQLSQRGKPRTLQDILTAAQTGEVRDLPVIIKTDTPGSVEALRGEILKFQHPEVRVNILHEGVGGVNESDVYLASASGAIIIAFHVVPEDSAQVLADREGVEIRRYGIIYEVTDDIKNALEGLLRPDKVEVLTGRAVVLQTFAISRFGLIAGCRVLNGVIERNNRIHLIRDQRILNDYNILSLKRGKDDAKEVREGLECGIRLEGFDDIKEGDIFQAFRVDEVKRTLQ